MYGADKTSVANAMATNGATSQQLWPTSCVDAIVRHYDGEVQLADSALGGLAIALVLPFDVD